MNQEDIEDIVELELMKLNIALDFIQHGLSRGWTLPMAIGNYIVQTDAHPEVRREVVYLFTTAWWILAPSGR